MKKMGIIADTAHRSKIGVGLASFKNQLSLQEKSGLQQEINVSPN
jgi:hypothetical protein